MNLRELRKTHGVSLDSIALALGAGFSRPRLGLVERGSVKLESWEEARVREAIIRIGAYQSRVDAVVQEIRERDTLAAICRDIREGRFRPVGAGV